MQPGGRDVTGVEKKHMLVVTLLGLELQPGGPHCSSSVRRVLWLRVDWEEVGRGDKGSRGQGEVHGSQERVPSPPPSTRVTLGSSPVLFGPPFPHV